MNVQLRKRHRKIWLSMAVALPLLFVLAYLAIPPKPLAAVPVIACPAGMTTCALGDEHTDWSHALSMGYQAADSIANLKIQVTKPLKSSFTLVYLSNSEEFTNEATLLGQLAEMKEYSFQVPMGTMNDHKFVLIQDQLKSTTLAVQPLTEIVR